MSPLHSNFEIGVAQDSPIWLADLAKSLNPAEGCQPANSNYEASVSIPALGILGCTLHTAPVEALGLLLLFPHLLRLAHLRLGLNRVLQVPSDNASAIL